MDTKKVKTHGQIHQAKVLRYLIFTVRNSSCGKVMFSQASVILFTGGRAWQGACMAGGMCGRGVCMAGGMHGRGHEWQGVVHGRRQERWPLQRTVRILLECILVKCAKGLNQKYSTFLILNNYYPPQ